jgi:hypothetical protein
MPSVAMISMKYTDCAITYTKIDVTVN